MSANAACACFLSIVGSSNGFKMQLTENELQAIHEGMIYLISEQEKRLKNDKMGERESDFHKMRLAIAESILQRAELLLLEKNNSEPNW